MAKLPFSIRTTAAVSAFPCIFLAAPTQGAAVLPGVTGAQLGSLATVFASLTNNYPLLLNQDTGAGNAARLATIINTLVTAVQSLVTVLGTIVVTNADSVPLPFNTGIQQNVIMTKADAQALLTNYQIIAANALTQLKQAQSAAADNQ